MLVRTVSPLPTGSVQGSCTTHDWRLVEVEFEDGRTIRVYRCLACEGETLQA